MVGKTISSHLSLNSCVFNLHLLVSVMRGEKDKRLMVDFSSVGQILPSVLV
jgi:hypothetical protein